MNRKMQDRVGISKRTVLMAGLVSLLLFSGVVAQTGKPITKNGLLEAIRIGGLTTSELVRQVQQRGVDFELTDDIVGELRRAGAAPELVRAVNANRRAGKPPVKPANVVPNETPRINLGLNVQDMTAMLAATLGLSDARGVFVSTVEQGSLADKAGAERRDVITAFNGVLITNTDELRRQVARLRSGEAISLTVLRDGSMQKLNGDATSASGKNQESNVAGDRGISGKGRLGLRVEPLTPQTVARFNLAKAKGLVVVDVDASGPAAVAGIKTGDVIEEINGQSVRIMADIETALARADSGRIRLRINRGGKSSTVDLQSRTTMSAR